jgi:hypothetical protein
MTTSTKDTQAQPTPKWLERRPLPGFGIVAEEQRVTAAAAAPSPDAIQVADTTPEHDWEPGRQWLPHAGPLGLATEPVV